MNFSNSVVKQFTLLGYCSNRPFEVDIVLLSQVDVVYYNGCGRDHFDFLKSFVVKCCKL